MRIVELDSGTITIDGEDISSHGLSKLRKVSGCAVRSRSNDVFGFLFVVPIFGKVSEMRSVSVPDSIST